MASSKTFLLLLGLSFSVVLLISSKVLGRKLVDDEVQTQEKVQVHLNHFRGNEHGHKQGYEHGCGYDHGYNYGHEHGHRNEQGHGYGHEHEHGQKYGHGYSKHSRGGDQGHGAGN
ncbi:uncharacterized protein LOC110646357 [Hevea brasiliensis]|uniref:uncharacterized protein LOC110646357 n=1 Tax=Hevea brasiliensis TaxID=3981 RepID=UPI0025F81A6D|nr:uncharacterized protein LOC110646357 [Hevea brasiliensis]